MPTLLWIAFIFTINTKNQQAVMAAQTEQMLILSFRLLG